MQIARYRWSHIKSLLFSGHKPIKENIKIPEHLWEKKKVKGKGGKKRVLPGHHVEIYLHFMTEKYYRASIEALEQAAGGTDSMFNIMKDTIKDQKAKPRIEPRSESLIKVPSPKVGITTDEEEEEESDDHSTYHMSQDPDNMYDDGDDDFDEEYGNWDEDGDDLINDEFGGERYGGIDIMSGTKARRLKAQKLKRAHSDENDPDYVDRKKWEKSCRYANKPYVVLNLSLNVQFKV